MPNTDSAKKAVRSSKRKQAHNLFWKNKYKGVVKSLKKGLESGEEPKILSEKLVLLQKTLDKAAKEKVIHKNKANRLKSRYAQKISAKPQETKKATAGKTKSDKKVGKK